MSTAYYDVLSQSYAEWTGHLVNIFSDIIHNYLTNLFQDAEAYAKKNNKGDDYKFILGVFQRFCLGIKDWSIRELNTQIVVLRYKYTNLQGLIDHAIESTLSVMATSRRSTLNEIEVPHVSVASFVHKSFIDAGANVGCKYALLFDKVYDIVGLTTQSDVRVAQIKRFENYDRAQVLIENQIRTTIKNFLPLAALDGPENNRPVSPRRLSPRSKSPNRPKSPNRSKSPKQRSPRTRRIKSLTAKNLQELDIVDDITPDDSASKVLRTKKRQAKKKPTKTYLPDEPKTTTTEEDITPTVESTSKIDRNVTYNKPQESTQQPSTTKSTQQSSTSKSTHEDKVPSQRTHTQRSDKPPSQRPPSQRAQTSSTHTSQKAPSSRASQKVQSQKQESTAQQHEDVFREPQPPKRNPKEMNIVLLDSTEAPPPQQTQEQPTESTTSSTSESTTSQESNESEATNDSEGDVSEGTEEDDSYVSSDSYDPTQDKLLTALTKS